MDARFFKKILVLVGILLFSVPIMTQPAMAQEMPAGVIVIWSGSPGAVPDGWAVCDGGNGTPNLPPINDLAYIMKLPMTYDCSNVTFVASYPFPSEEGGAPSGLAYYKNLYVALRGPGKVAKVKVFQGSLKILSTIDLPGDCPDGITGLTHDGNNLWYTNDNGGGTCTPQIWNFTESGELLAFFDSPTLESVGLAFDGDFLWNTEERGGSPNKGMIYKVTTTGEKVAEFASPGYTPRDLTFHGDYLWHVDSDANSLYKLDSLGNVLAACSLESEGISRPVGLTSDGTYLWLAEEGTGRIHKISLGN